MLAFHLLSIIAIIGTLASAAPAVVLERTTCTAYCSTTDNQGRPLVEQEVVPDIDLLYCEWKNGTTQNGYYYANGSWGPAGGPYESDDIVYPPFPNQPATMPVSCS